ncbi:hypothetical protein B0H13DRAFT_2303423 [Mycena leptocephala]|nr:hypothetical protein B0H13DRAFT_2303423 [Mycena leptocephala]
MTDNPFLAFFYRGAKQNQNQWLTYDKGCVWNHFETTGVTMTDLTQGTQAFKDGASTRGDKLAWIAHLIAGHVS